MEGREVVEKCGKVWQQERGITARDGVYSRPAASRVIEMRACSACAGDYEDADRTAWTPDSEEDEEREGTQRVGTEEFPAEE
jgi:hypothetical protein